MGLKKRKPKASLKTKQKPKKKRRSIIKNIRIITLILLLIALSVLSIAAVGVYGYFSIDKINKNVKNISQNNVESLVILGEIRNDVLLTRSDVVKNLFGGYDPNGAYRIEDNNGNIEKLNGDYQKFLKNEVDKVAFNQYVLAYKAYMEQWGEQKKSLIAKKTIEDMDKRDTMDKSDRVTEALANLITTNKSEADALAANSQSVYNNTKVINVVLISVVFIILCLTGVFTIFVIRKSMNSFFKRLETVSSGSFAEDAETPGRNEFGKMTGELNHAIRNISKIMLEIKEQAMKLNHQSIDLSQISDNMSTAAHGISESVQEVAAGSESQAGELSEMKKTAEHFGQEIHEIVVDIGNVDKLANNASSLANASNTKLEELVESINQINAAFDGVNNRIIGLGDNISKIKTITDLINSIADQTNLLALNAAIEAARAGEAGRGFAIVADEIRTLAEQSKTSSDNIKKLLDGIFNETQIVVDTTNAVGGELGGQIHVVEMAIESFKEIIHAINDILPKIGNIVLYADTIEKDKAGLLYRTETASAAAEDISNSAEMISASTQELNSSSVEVAKAAATLSDMTTAMIADVDIFKF